MFSKTLALPVQSRAAIQNNPCSVPVIIAVLAVCCFALLASSPMQAQVNTINTVAGGAHSATQALSADLPGPVAVAKDANGNVYISAPYTYYIFKVTPAGAMSIYAGTGVYAGGGDNGPATKAGLAGVLALALDSKGDLYLSDKGNNNIRCIIAVSGGCGGSALPVGDIVEIVDTTGKVCYPSTAPCGDGGPAVNAQISYAEALFIDSGDNLWISDTLDYRVRCVVGSAGGCAANLFYGQTYPVGDIITVAGTGQFCDGPQDICGNNGPALQAYFDYAGGIAVDTAGNFYIADTRDFTVRCVVVVAGGCGGSTQPVGNVTIFAGSGDYCSNPLSPCGDGGPAANANLWNPNGLGFDRAGDLYIADTMDNRIRCVIAVKLGCGGSKSAVGDIVTVAGNGSQGFSGDGAAATSAALNLPFSLFVGPNGVIWIADTGNQRIREVGSGQISTIAGGGSDGNGGSPTSATLANPNAVVWDSTGDYYISDSANNQVREVTSAGAITVVAGTGLAGPPNTTTTFAVNATLNAPSGVALDSYGDIFIADTGNQVVRAVVAASGHILTVAGNGNSCTPNNGKCGDGGPATEAELTDPTSVAIDSSGNIYIADDTDHRIRCVLAVSGGCGGSPYAPGDITTIAGTGQRCGYLSDCGNNGPATKAKLSRAYGVAVDSFGNVYITDSGDNQVRCVIEVAGGCGGSTYPVGTIVAFAFNGKASFTGDGGPALNASMSNPLEIEVDAHNNVFVGGGADNLVRRIDATSLTIETVAGNTLHPQVSGFAGDGGPSTQATLDNIGLSVDPNGNLLIADAGNNRIREVSLAAVASLSKKTLTFPNEPVGQASTPMAVILKNSGYVDLPLSGEQLEGYDAADFSISSNSCGNQLAPGQSCSISVVFTPSKAGKRTAKLEINDSLGQQLVSLVGTGE